MTFNRALAAALLAACLSHGAAAQARIPLDDETIFSAVEQALQHAPSLVAARITVQSREGFVTLGGVADTTAQIAAAARIASRVRGVTGVHSEIRITNRGSRA